MHAPHHGKTNSARAAACYLPRLITVNGFRSWRVGYVPSSFEGEQRRGRMMPMVFVEGNGVGDNYGDGHGDGEGEGARPAAAATVVA